MCARTARKVWLVPWEKIAKIALTGRSLSIALDPTISSEFGAGGRDHNCYDLPSVASTLTRIKLPKALIIRY